MYVWAFHTTQPKVEVVTVYVQHVQPCWKVLLAYTQTRDETYSNVRRFLLASRTAFDATPMDLESPEMITIHLMLSIVALPCDGNKKFRDSCFHRISQLVCYKYALPLRFVAQIQMLMMDRCQRLSGRKRPSRHRINFLLHLDDHRQCAFRGLRRAKVLVQDISNFAKQPQSASSQALNRICERCDKLITDLKNLEHDFNSLEEMLMQTRDLVSTT